MNIDADEALRHLEQQLLVLFTALQRGEDVSPANSYRAEGFAAALVTLGLRTEADVAACITGCWRQVFNIAPPDSADSLSIPVIMQRAPVFPSTSD